jgi:iron complex outermembrane recepter protein
LQLRIFATLQRTQISGYDYNNPTAANQLNFNRGVGQNVRDSSFVNGSTPSLYGGIDVNYIPLTRLNVNLNAYFYAAQTVSFTSASLSDNQSLNTANIAANFLLNAAVSYEPTPGIKLFVNARNLLGGNQRQFAFSDVIKLYLTGGINLSL